MTDILKTLIEILLVLIKEFKDSNIIEIQLSQLKESHFNIVDQIVQDPSLLNVKDIVGLKYLEYLRMVLFFRNKHFERVAALA